MILQLINICSAVQPLVVQGNTLWQLLLWHPRLLTPPQLSSHYLELNGYFLLFLEDYKLDQDLELSFDSFKLMFQRMSHL
jgi:hypothetical protein